MKSIPLSRFTYNPDHDMGKEKNALPSKTQPEQTLPLRTLLDRFSRGQSVPSFQPVYDSDSEEEMPDVSKMSPIELTELQDEVKKEIKIQRDNLSRRKKSAKATKAKKESSTPDDAIIVPPTTPPPTEG